MFNVHSGKNMCIAPCNYCL